MGSVTHGGHHWQAAEDLNMPGDQIIDFSANINPLGPPASVKTLLADSQHLQELAIHYPRADYAPLLKALAKKFEVPENEIVLGNGATELLSHVLGKENKVLLPEVAYGEYAGSCHRSQVPTLICTWEDMRSASKNFINLLNSTEASAVVLPLPNNPSADIPSLDTLKKYLNDYPDINWVIDASFLMFVDNWKTYWAFLKNTQAHIVMSLTKYYAIPGLRLGWLKASADNAKKINQSLDPWRINAIAAEAGTLALNCPNYDTLTTQWLTTEKQFCHTAWSQRAELHPSTPNALQANFLLLKFPNATRHKSILSQLTRQGLLVRDASSFGLTNTIRIAIKDRPNNQKLLTAFDKIILGNTSTLNQ